MPSNPIFFQKMLEIYEKIKPESLAVYYSILIHLYRAEFCINIDEFDEFLTSLTNTFDESCKNVSIYSNLYQENEENEENLD